MGSVYQGGVLNIAATGFPDGSNGLFVKRDPNLITPICVAVKRVTSHQRQSPESVRSSRAQTDLFYIFNDWTWREGIMDAPLIKRAWVLQERALSVRTVHFGRQQLFWECMAVKATEIYPSFVDEPVDSIPKLILRLGADEEKGERQISQEMSSWVDVVKTYSRCSLTYSSDKLVAVAGMARFLAKRMDCEYLAGLWRRDLRHQLLWSVVDEPAAKRHTTRAPSWSWASVDAPVFIRGWDHRWFSLQTPANDIETR